MRVQLNVRVFVRMFVGAVVPVLVPVIVPVPVRVLDCVLDCALVRAAIPLLLASLLLAGLPGTASAVGPVVTAEARTNYYTDNDGNRIVTPHTSVNANLGDSVSLSAHGSLDIMTCASVDVISAATPKGYFRETRREAGGGVAVKRGLASLSGKVTTSRENDYSSITVGAGWSDEFMRRNITVALAYSFTGSNVGRAGDPNFNRDLNSHTFSASLTQVLSPRWIAKATAWFGLLDGFQSSVYRFVHYANGASAAEVMPSRRMRESTVLQFRGALNRALFVALSYRLYGDTWGLLAHSAEAALSWSPKPSIVLRVRDRVHTQRGSPYYRSSFERPMRYMSIDRELGGLWGNLVGAKLSVLLANPGPAARLEFDLKVDEMWQSFDDFPWLPERNWTVSEIGLSADF